MQVLFSNFFKFFQKLRKNPGNMRVSGHKNFSKISFKRQKSTVGGLENFLLAKLP